MLASARSPFNAVCVADLQSGDTLAVEEACVLAPWKSTARLVYGNAGLASQLSWWSDMLPRRRWLLPKESVIEGSSRRSVGCPFTTEPLVTLFFCCFAAAAAQAALRLSIMQLAQRRWRRVDEHSVAVPCRQHAVVPLEQRCLCLLYCRGSAPEIAVSLTDAFTGEPSWP